MEETKISPGKQSFSTTASSITQALNGQHKQLKCRASWDGTGHSTVGDLISPMPALWQDPEWTSTTDLQC